MRAAGYRRILATPLRWHGASLGGLNLFWTEPAVPDSDQMALAQAFADGLTLTLVNAHPVPVEYLRERVDEALRGRVVIERAKGVLAHNEELTMEEAFERLLRLSEEQSRSLTEVAESVVAAAIRASGSRAP
jgi:hypothetical protein